MLAVQTLTTQLRSQTLADSASSASSSQEETGSKVRHHSEPQPPRSLLAESAKKVKLITFEDGSVDGGMCVSSLLFALPAGSSAWDCSSNPPNKRPCRSMSIPNDGELQARWLQTQTRARLHRPVAVRPGSGGSRSKASHHSRGLSLWPPAICHDVNTPPESPRSRPSSASSGYFDSPLTSISNLTKNKCESLHTLPSRHTPDVLGGTDDTSRSSYSVRVLSAKSMPSVSAGECLQSSPQKQRLLRCKSQPCVTHVRRCGTKRRHEDADYSRPSINFHKMAETAYSETTVHATDVSYPLLVRQPHRFGLPYPERVLQTIASSPQDAITAITAASTSPERVKEPSPENDETVDAASDSGCSAMDNEVCDITHKIDEGGSGQDCSYQNCSCQNCACQSCACRCDEQSLGSEEIFYMDPADNAANDLDLDMIENN